MTRTGSRAKSEPFQPSGRYAKLETRTTAAKSPWSRLRNQGNRPREGLGDNDVLSADGQLTSDKFLQLFIGQISLIRVAPCQNRYALGHVAK